MMNNYRTIPYQPIRFSEEEMMLRARSFFELMQKRRSVRHFSERPVPQGILDYVLQTAGSAPSGANRQPWTFCLVTDAELKRRIRQAAEEEEYKAYHGGMPQEWLNDLSYLGTDWHKEFLETAPALIVVFRKPYDIDEQGQHKNYYVQESVGLACGFLLAAIQYCGLVALTHTPSPMNFLQGILQRAEWEKPYLLIPVGYPADDAEVPDIHRKNLSEIVTRFGP
ncbi:MAG: nitroreductase family protein [Saprospiraceae bacterium]|nr:nitroreductase family protein [Saprospiraceae bacterium]HMW38393.1 nitroreductase family protein [Saprospiraceae bacterium]HMX87288.1 nitroreductase family protein [Saprospiraceae bacterium]HMZ39115.1 nitroreductase family protein [Saprospiraceae bacterium]HNA63288.1 nitroreductase family protein [Saprospiraceae bacterium]